MPWAQPAEPALSKPAFTDRFSRHAARRSRRSRRKRQDDLAAFHELRAGSDVERALRTFEVVFLKCVARFAVQFVKQISFRQFLSNHLAVVHSEPPHFLILDCYTRLPTCLGRRIIWGIVSGIP